MRWPLNQTGAGYGGEALVLARSRWTWSGPKTGASGPRPSGCSLLAFLVRGTDAAEVGMVTGCGSGCAGSGV